MQLPTDVAIDSPARQQPNGTSGSGDAASTAFGHLIRGLSPQEVPGRRVAAGGPNEFAVKAPDPPWLKFLQQLSEPLILLLLGSAAVSLLIGETDDAISIAVAVIIVITVGFVQEQRSEKSLEALNKLVPHFCHLIRNDGGLSSHAKHPQENAGDGATGARKVLGNELVPGDVVTFSAGDRVPADVRLFQSVQLEVDESTLTGEIKPRRKTAQVIDPEMELEEISGWEKNPEGVKPKTGTSERDNIVFMGTLVKSGEWCQHSVSHLAC